MEQESILIVEDNDRLRRFVSSALTKNGYKIFEAESGKAAYSVLKQNYLDLVLLDLKLGDVNGIEILKTIRRQDEKMPVIIISSVNDRNVKVDGFEIGCDDYITKPFYVDELLGRVKRLLKRTAHRVGSAVPISQRLISGPFEFEISSLSVYKNGTQIAMRKKLFDLFLYFVRHEGVILSNENLFNEVWDFREDLNDNSLYVHIRHLRSLIEDDPSKPLYIRTVRNAGYVYEAPKV